MSIIVNMLAFQAAWFACVLGGAAGLWWLGPAATLPVVALFVASAPGRRKMALGFVVFTTLVGVVIETLASGRVYDFVEQGGMALPRLQGLAWMAALWAGFATTLPRSLAWCSRRPLLAILCGASFGPLAFVAGEKLGALRLDESRTMALCSLAVVWAIAMPALGHLALRVVGTSGAARPSGARGEADATESS